MKFLKRIKKISGQPVILTIGNFDGLHLGHRKIIGRVIKAARQTGSLAMAVTFFPHPQEILGHVHKVNFLNTHQEKLYLFEKTGLDYLWQLKFSRNFAGRSPENFFKYLKKFLNIKKVIIGFNFAFGAGRSGRLAHLRRIGQKLGFEVQVVAPVKFRQRVISSSLIRQLLNAGEIERVALKLGGFYPVFGKVIHGQGLGRELGFPTANLKISEEKLLPGSGVYLAEVENNCARKPALVNIGFPDGKKTPDFEVFIPHFSGNLYGKILKVFLFKQLRPEKKFKNQAALQKQIARDVKRMTHP